MALLLAYFTVFVLAASVPATGQQGFLSIDCGLDQDYNTDSLVGDITYVSDGAYVDAGENRRVTTVYKDDWKGPRYQTLYTLRSFPSSVTGDRNCYSLPTNKGDKYNVRLEFLYGNYDGLDSASLTFNLTLGVNHWDTVILDTAIHYGYKAYAAVFVAWAMSAPVCLVNTGGGTPFVSTVELRPFESLAYPTDNQSLSLYERKSMRSGADVDIIRFPDDQYDRYWYAWELTGNDPYSNISTQSAIELNTTFMVPLRVLQTAFVPDNKTREFTVSIDSGVQSGPISPPYLKGWSIINWSSDSEDLSIKLVATATSALPPILNAYEVYSRIIHEYPMTFSQDFEAIMAIKYEYGIRKNWMGDPCYPSNSVWDGVQCTNPGDDKTMRIISLDLSNSELQGPISYNFTLFSALKYLNLSCNQLTGTIPDYLRKSNGSIVFSYESDGDMCKKPITSSSSRNRAATLAVSVVAPVLVVTMLVVAFLIWRAKRKPHVSTDDSPMVPQLICSPRHRTNHLDHLKKPENRRFTYEELAREVQNLTKVNHRNLVSLIGYCWEKEHLALVYEYMSSGNLSDYLRGKAGLGGTLNWATRIRVMLEAAQGLDYLHKGCNLPIIHGDVKTNNILLGRNLKAKIADFGLSKTYHSDSQTHVSATVAGSMGYIDPEYYVTGRLTERSDVYSFGIVTSGEPPIIPGNGHIIQRVMQKMVTGNISSVADARLGGSYNVNSMWKVLDAAMMCTADIASQRPMMSAVVTQLKESLELEEAPGNKGDMENVARDDTSSMSMFSPSAR
uniref:non-specific serine/threonine protein kinase n=1 Tax=Oryza rufipogon TaxID=4529 RepID=A0A0E0QQ74_ORYRU